MPTRNVSTILGSLALSLIATVAARSSTTYAACIRDTKWSNATLVYEQIPVYIRAPESEEDPPCEGDVRRAGYSILDFEQQVLLFIGRVNEMMADKPILVYGGRICLSSAEMELTVPDPGDKGYNMTWDEQTNGLPLGIEIMVMRCGTELGATASSLAYKPICGVTHGVVRFTAYHDDEGNMCPRAVEGSTPECAIPANGVEGTPCAEGDQVACTCLDGDNGQNYGGWHKCHEDDLKYTACRCLGRGYERFSLGVGRDAPFEEPICDALGDENTKDILHILLHEGAHVLGMHHSDLPALVCVDDDNILGVTIGFDEAEGAISRSPGPRWLGSCFYSENEIQGFQAMFAKSPPALLGAELGTGWDNEWTPVFYESTDSGATWSAAQSFGTAAADAATRVAVSSTAVDAMSPSREFQAFAWATREGQVMHAVRDADGFHDLGANAEVGSTTFFPPTVAVGEDRLLIAWIFKNAEERGSLWAVPEFAHRGLDAADAETWIRGPHFTFLYPVYHRQIEAGYDATTDLFVIVTLTQGNDPMVRGSQLHVAELDVVADDDDYVDRFPLLANDAPQAIDFSAPVCFFDDVASTSRCTILFNQILLTGVALSSISWTPGNGGVDVEHAPLDLVAVGSFELVTTVGGTDFFGLLGTNGTADGFRFLTAGRATDSGLLDDAPSVTAVPVGWFAEPIHPQRLPGLGSRMTTGGDLILTAVGVDVTQPDGTREPVECADLGGSESESGASGSRDDEAEGDVDGSDDSSAAADGGPGASDGCACRGGTSDNGHTTTLALLLLVTCGFRLPRRPPIAA